MKSVSQVASDAKIYASRIIRGLSNVAGAKRLVELARELQCTAEETESQWLCRRLKAALLALIESWNENHVVSAWQPSVVTSRTLFGLETTQHVNAPVRLLALQELANACRC